MQANHTIQYILELVLQDISILEAQHESLQSEFISDYDYWMKRDVNHGQLLALAKVRGRLEAMLEYANTPEVA
jgi:hypothetical protein